MQFLHLWVTSLLDGLDFTWSVSFRIKKKFFLRRMSLRGCSGVTPSFETFWLWFWGSGPAGWMRPPRTFSPHPSLGPGVCVLILSCADCSFGRLRAQPTFLLPLTCDQFNSVFQWKKEVFCILQGCNILLGYIFLQIFLASRSLKGFSLSFAFLCAYDFFISVSSLFCSWNSCRMDVGFCISWLCIFLCFLTRLLR